MKYEKIMVKYDRGGKMELKNGFGIKNYIIGKKDFLKKRIFRVMKIRVIME